MIGKMSLFRRCKIRAAWFSVHLAVFFASHSRAISSKAFSVARTLSHFLFLLMGHRVYAGVEQRACFFPFLPGFFE